MAEEQRTQEGQRLTVGPDLYVVMVKGSALKEQDINAQMMEPGKFDRLTENIKGRGGLESLPYCHQPNGTGPISIVSGHHRAKAARAAGLAEFPVLIDTRDMPKSAIRAKQIAHNELAGSPDEEILRRMIAEIDNVDDLLATGLSEDYFPEIEQSSTTLSIPHVEFEWRMVTLTFLPKQMTDFTSAVEAIDRASDLVGVADVEQFEAFSKACFAYSKAKNIKSMGAVISTLTDIANREVAAHREALAAAEPADAETPSAE